MRAERTSVYILVLFLFSGFLVYFSAWKVEEEMIREQMESVDQLMKIAEARVKKEIKSLDPKTFDRLRIELESTLPLKIGLVSKNFESLPFGLDKERILKQVGSDEVSHLRLKGKKDREFVVGVKRLILKGSDVAKLVVAYEVRRPHKGYILLSFLLLLGAVVVSIHLYRNLIRPAKSVLKICKELGQKQPGSGVERLKDFKDVPSFLEKMKQKTEGRIRDLLEELKDLKSVFSQISDALVVLDGEGRIKRFNEAAKEIFGQDIREGIYLFESVREPEISELLKEHMRKIESGEHFMNAEISFKRRVFKVSGSYAEKKGERVYLFHDITKEKELDKTKREFIANLSHEMRTPLSAIKGFVETLEQEKEGEEKMYLETIKRNTERLIRIVDDLLYISRIEEGKEFFYLEEVDLEDAIAVVLKIFEPEIKKKGLELVLGVERGLKIKVDRYQLENILINLIDNAIKYTERGYVKVSATKKDDRVLITVEDSGYGIPEKDHERIFERFYVVDKSRSKKYGGVGLGLSIVKHLVEARGGKITLWSSPGMGSRFTVHLPAS